MKCLNEFATKKHRRDLLQRKKLHFEKFALIQVRLAELLHASCKKTVRPVVRAGSIAAESIQQSPFSAAVSGFLHQFALRPRKR